MKIKIWLLGLLFSIALGNCSSDKETIVEETQEEPKEVCAKTCNAGFVLNEENCECEEDETPACTKVCDAGFTLNTDTCECEENAPLSPLCNGIVQPTPSLLKDDVDNKNNTKCSIFLEENGLLIMEAENTLSDYTDSANKWVFSSEPATVKKSGQDDVHVTETTTDHKGTGYLQYTGAYPWSDTETPSRLTYTFKIKNTGDYRLFIRNLKGLNEEGDKHNDCFVKMEGDFEIGEVDKTCIDTKGLEVVPTGKGILTKDYKFFGASNEKWNISGKLDTHGSYKAWALYKLKAGQIYTLTLTGRSKKYFIDRILLVDIHKYNYGTFNNYTKNAVQSSCE